MHDIQIGTMIGAGNVSKIMPKLIPYGFETFSVNFGESAAGCDMEQLAKVTAGIIEGTHSSVSSLATYSNPLLDTEKGEAAVNSLEILINSARLFGTDLVACFAGRLPDLPVDASIPRFKEVFTPLAKLAKDKGVRIAFENCPMGGDWNQGGINIAYSPKAWEMIFDAVPYDNIGLQWEPCHQMAQFIDPIAQLRKWAGKVFCLHGKDATVAWDIIKEQGIHSGETYLWHRTPGFGDCSWTDIISILRMSGFKGSIDIEGWHDPVYRGDLEYTGQVHALNYLKSCRGGELIPNFEA